MDQDLGGHQDPAHLLEVRKNDSWYTSTRAPPSPGPLPLWPDFTRSPDSLSKYSFSSLSNPFGVATTTAAFFPFTSSSSAALIVNLAASNSGVSICACRPATANLISSFTSSPAGASMSPTLTVRL